MIVIFIKIVFSFDFGLSKHETIISKIAKIRKYDK